MLLDIGYDTPTDNCVQARVHLNIFPTDASIRHCFTKYFTTLDFLLNIEETVAIKARLYHLTCRHRAFQSSRTFTLHQGRLDDMPRMGYLDRDLSCSSRVLPGDRCKYAASSDQDKKKPYSTSAYGTIERGCRSHRRRISCPPLPSDAVGTNVSECESSSCIW